MLIKDIMIKEVVTVSPFASLRLAMTLMRKHRIKSVVVEKQSPCDAYGLITYSTIVKTISVERGDIDLINVYDVYQKPTITVGSDIDVRHAAKLMINYNLKRILVVNNNELQGIVSMHDIVEEMFRVLEP